MGMKADQVAISPGAERQEEKRLSSKTARMKGPKIPQMRRLSNFLGRRWVRHRWLPKTHLLLQKYTSFA